MPKVTKFEVFSHCNDLGGKVWNPAIKWTKKYAIFVQLEVDSGLVGLGECWCFDSAPDTLVSFLRTEVAPHVVGVPVDSLEGLCKQLTLRATLSARHGMLASALSGVDIAAWDIRSQEAGLPLWIYLRQFINHSSHSHFESGDEMRGVMRLYASGGLYGQDKSVADLSLEMSNMTSRGFDTVKMKVGGLSLAEDQDRVHAVLNTLDDACKLIIDGVYSYTPAQALELFRSLPTERIEAFQSPTTASNLSGMTLLCDAGVPVMGTEAEYREELHQQLISRGCVQFLQTAPIACGGYSRLIELNKQIQQCDNKRINLSLEVSSTAVALIAACHFAAASDLVAHTEYHFVHQVFFDQLGFEPMATVPGFFQLPEKPGLGIRLHFPHVKRECSVSAT